MIILAQPRRWRVPSHNWEQMLSDIRHERDGCPSKSGGQFGGCFDHGFDDAQDEWLELIERLQSHPAGGQLTPF